MSMATSSAGGTSVCTLSPTGGRVSVALELEAAQRQRLRRGFFDQQLAPAMVSTSPAMMMRAPPTGDRR